MLAEAWKISQSLAEVGGDIPRRATDVMKPGLAKRQTLRVLIHDDGQVSLLPVTDPATPLWVLRKGNFFFWPVVRPNDPCWNDGHAVERNLARFAHERKGGSDKHTPEVALRMHRDVLAECLFDWPGLLDLEPRVRAEHWAKIATPNGPPELLTLCDRLDRLRADPAPLRLAVERARENEDLAAALVALALGQSAQGDKAQVAFDLPEATVYSPVVRQALETAVAAVGRGTGASRVCSLAGREDHSWHGPFPTPELPCVSRKGVPLFSMFREVEANTRYGRTGTDLLTVGEGTVQAALDALLYAVEPERLGRTWTSMPSGKVSLGKEANDLLIAHAVDVEAPLAHGFGSGEPDEAYEDALGSVLEALSGVSTARPRATVLLVLLRQISDGQAQAVYCRQPRAREVLDAGTRWSNAQRTVPRLCFQGPTAKRLVISPGSLVACLCRDWTSDAARDTPVPGPSAGEVLDLMLASGPERALRADPMLALLVARCGSLMRSAAVRARTCKLPKRLQPEAARAAAATALLLDALGHPMDQDSPSPAYCLGLLLGLVDTLHLTYCRHERQSVPPTLGGNQLIGIACDDPPRALAELLERSRPWQSWANTCEPRGEKDPLIAKKTLSRLGRLAPKLAGRVPARLDDQARAELLLGYLSHDSCADDTPAGHPDQGTEDAN
ncbi:MAG: hypothetical protein KIS66_02465 [Fimbriimonadaceae bacterium]|nr:hypothetical protein [Fimbriimonadaceae bacterium]